MSGRVEKWLKTQLDRLPNVRGCAFGPADAVSAPARDADLIVHLWSGVRAHIHLLTEPLHARTARRILDEATGIGVSTLFLVDLRQLPDPDQALPGDTWLVMLAALTDGQLYVFQEEPQALYTVRFHNSPETGALQACCGDNMMIRQMRCYRKGVKSNLLKGNWMVADFGPADSRQQAYPRWTRQQFDYRQAHHQGQDTASAQLPALQPPRLRQCYELLGVGCEASCEEVKSAFRKRALEFHPDVSSLPKDEAEMRFKALSEAYEHIKSEHGWA